MPSPLPSSPAKRSIRRVLAIGFAAAGLYAVLLGPVGALGQDPSPTPDSTPSATPTVIETVDPSPTSTSTPEETPTSEPTQAGTPESTPTETPAGTATPDQTATATPGETATATPDGTATPAAEQTYSSAPSTHVVIDDTTVDTPANDHAHDKCADTSSSKKPIKKGSTSGRGSDCKKVAPKKEPIRSKDGTPTLANPTLSIADIGPAPIGVPNFFIDKFRIPPFLLSIYQAAGMQYGVRWEVLAAINEIETDYGRNLNVSSAGALGWMQFMPATWEQYGTDANKDGVRDPFNPVDAIFAAARYLRAAGADQDLRKAIFAYNHADWYVDSVLMRARLIGGLPSNFVGSLTGLTQARFPVYAKARYAGDLDEKKLSKKVKKGQNAAMPVESATGRRGIKIFSRAGAPVIAVNDGKIVRVGKTKRLGNYVQLQDVYGNVFTYARLAKVSATYPSPRPRRVSAREIAKQLDLPRKDAAPKTAATGGSNKAPAGGKQRLSAKASTTAEVAPADSKSRLFAHPTRPAARAAGGELQLAEADYRPIAGSPLKLSRRDYQAKPLKKGARVIAGTILGRIGRTSARMAPHVLFEIRPAGRGAPRIDPKPILDGWKLLESTEIYRAANRNPFFGPDAETPSVGQILLMSKEALMRHVLANPRIEIYECGRRDIRIGNIDRRVLATLEFLAASGLKPAVSSLNCGHGFYTASGNVSAHSSGNAVDIAAINGIPIIGHQGPGSITEVAVQRLLTLQGTMRPDQIITLMKFEGADNTLAMGDHDDHIHVGWRPLYGTNSKAAKQVNAILKPKQWIKLIDRLKEIQNPEVAPEPSRYALRVDTGKPVKSPAPQSASDAHRGE
jgi:murein DD-endopeptidase MepM/ murein hydrolase activator NlpD